MGIEEAVNERMEEAGTIHLMDNKVVGPLILQAEQKGRRDGKVNLLLELLTEKSGVLPGWALDRVHAASAAELQTWAKRVLQSMALEDTLR